MHDNLIAISVRFAAAQAIIVHIIQMILVVVQTSLVQRDHLTRAYRASTLRHK